LLEHICHEFVHGLELLQLDPLHIPTVEHLNERINPHTGWRIKRTAVRYTLADDWYRKFAQRIFLITDYLRTRDQMEFTPEPDMFHDIFGHLPFLTQSFYAEIEDKFAPAYLKATQEEREVIKRLAWYSTEFGLVVQDNRFKVFGAGIISGRKELTRTIMEFYRLGRDHVIDFTQDVHQQLHRHFLANKNNLYRIIDGVNALQTDVLRRPGLERCPFALSEPGHQAGWHIRRRGDSRAVRHRNDRAHPEDGLRLQSDAVCMRVV
jgi:phenylalanine-4-hydroxylase